MSSFGNVYACTGMQGSLSSPSRRLLLYILWSSILSTGASFVDAPSRRDLRRPLLLRDASHGDVAGLPAATGVGTAVSPNRRRSLVGLAFRASSASRGRSLINNNPPQWRGRPCPFPATTIVGNSSETLQKARTSAGNWSAATTALRSWLRNASPHRLILTNLTLPIDPLAPPARVTITLSPRDDNTTIYTILNATVPPAALLRSADGYPARSVAFDLNATGALGDGGGGPAPEAARTVAPFSGVFVAVSASGGGGGVLSAFPLAPPYDAGVWYWAVDDIVTAYVGDAAAPGGGWVNAGYLGNVTYVTACVVCVPPITPRTHRYRFNA